MSSVKRSSPDRYEHDDSLRKDALVMASAMAVAETEEQTRSPEQYPKAGVSYRGERFTPGDGDEDEGSRDEPHLPRSPMVTPPIRRNSNSRGPTKPKQVHCEISAGVPHVYHDYSKMPEVADFPRKKTGGVTQPFPEKLHEMLSAVEETGETQTVSWLPHGRAFLVRRPKEFTEKIMPKHFKQTKLTSFQRQLNLYGFRRLTQGPDAGAYYHEMFLRARPALCQRMARQKVKGTGHKQPADAKTEPNFYLMAAVESMPDGEDGSIPRSYNDYPTGYQDHAASFDEEMQSAASRKTVVDLTSPSKYSRLPPQNFEMNSPASPGMQGAAHLLRGIAATYAASLSLPNASETSSWQMGDDATDESRRSRLQPRLSSPPALKRTSDPPDKQERW